VGQSQRFQLLFLKDPLCQNLSCLFEIVQPRINADDAKDTAKVLQSARVGWFATTKVAKTCLSEAVLVSMDLSRSGAQLSDSRCSENLMLIVKINVVSVANECADCVVNEQDKKENQP
jgi:hypothetical protein